MLTHIEQPKSTDDTIPSTSVQTDLIPITSLTPPLMRIISIAKSYHTNQDWVFHPVFLYTEGNTVYIPANGQDLIIQENDISALTPIHTDDKEHTPAVTRYLQTHAVAWYHITAILNSKECSHQNGVVGYYGFTTVTHGKSFIVPATIVFRIKTESRRKRIDGQMSTVYSYFETKFSATEEKELSEMEACFIPEEEVIGDPFMSRERTQYLKNLTHGESLWTSLRSSILRAGLTNRDVRHLLENNTVSYLQFGILYNGIYHETEVPDIESIRRILRCLILQINA